MDRGAWRATVPGVTRAGDDWVTKPLPPPYPRASLPDAQGRTLRVWLRICTDLARVEALVWDTLQLSF